jgi:hypothetical protein
MHKVCGGFLPSGGRNPRRVKGTSRSWRSCAANAVRLRLDALADNRGDAAAKRQPAWLPLQQAVAGAETLTIARDPANDAQRTMTTARRALLNMARS